MRLARQDLALPAARAQSLTLKTSCSTLTKFELRKRVTSLIRLQGLRLASLLSFAQSLLPLESPASASLGLAIAFTTQF